MPCRASSNCWIFGLHAAPSGLSQFCGVFLSRHECVQYLPSGNTQDIAGHRPQFDIGVLQELVDAIGSSRVFALELGAMPRQVAQFTLRPTRHKAAAQQAVLQQLRNPLGVLDVGLPARNLLQFPRVHQQQFKRPIQDVPHRLPQDSGGLHGDVRHAVRCQPLRKLQKIAGHGTEGTQIRIQFPREADATDRRDNRFLVQVQSCHALIDDLHDTPSYANRHLGGIGKGNNLPRVLPDHRGRQLQVRGDTQARLTLGLVAP